MHKTSYQNVYHIGYLLETKSVINIETNKSFVNLSVSKIKEPYLTTFLIFPIGNFWRRFSEIEPALRFLSNFASRLFIL